MKVATVFIPTTRPDDLSHCLQSLTPFSNQLQIHIVHSAPSTTIETIVAKFPILSIQCWQQQQAGLVAAANESFQRTTTTFFIRIDDDVTVEPRWLPSLLAPFENPTVAAVTGPTLVDSSRRASRDVLSFTSHETNTILARVISRFVADYLYEGNRDGVGRYFASGAYSLGANNHQSTHGEKPFPVDNVEACNFAVRTSVLHTLQGFDMSFNRGLGEYHEADLARALIKTRTSVFFAPGAIVHHHIHKTTASRPDALYRISNFIRFYRRYFPISSLDQLMRFCAFVAAQNGYYTMKFLQTGDVSQLGSYIGTLHGLLTDAQKRVPYTKDNFTRTNAI